MIQLNKFRAVAGVHQQNRVINLTQDKQGLTGSGRVVGWFKSLNRSRNREVTNLFINSLKATYGDSVTEQVVNSTGLATSLRQGRSLRSRDISVALDLAKRSSSQFREANRSLAASYGKPAAAGSGVSLLSIKLDDTARQLLGEGTEAERVKAFVDRDKLKQAVENRIAAFGDNGKRFVTSEEAANIVDKTVRDHLKFAPLNYAESRFSLADNHSLLRAALRNATGLTINPQHLSRNVIEDLNGKFYEVASTQVYSKPQMPEQGATAGAEGEVTVLSEKQLQSIANEVAERFVEERLAARQAVEQLDVADPALKSRLLEHVTHNTVPAGHVPALYKAYLQAADQLPVLGRQPPASAAELEKALASIHHIMTMAVADTRSDGSADSRLAASQNLWQFMLVSAGDAQLQGMWKELNRDTSLLRQFGEGANYFAHGFVMEDAFDTERHMSSYRKASEYDTMMGSLFSTLQERVGAQGKLPARQPPEMLSDAALNILRNTGIAMPAPERLGQSSDGMVPLSNSACKKLQDDLNKQTNAEKAVRVRDDGILEEAAKDFSRATYQVGGKTLERNTEAVAEGLHRFCTDEAGHLDEAMLHGISRVAYQSTLLNAFALFHPGNEDVAPFQHIPNLLQGGDAGKDFKVEYRLSKDEQGNVLLTARTSGKVHNMTQLTAAGLDTIDVDNDNSSLVVEMRIRLDGQNKFRPTLDSAGIDYSLMPPA